MQRKWRARLCLVLGLLALPFTVEAAELPSTATPAVRAAVSAWLVRHPGYAVMDEADCGCPEDLSEIRTLNAGVWRAQPGYHPYFVAGDLDGDGRADAAIGVRRGAGALRVLIVHGPKAEAPYLSPVFPRRTMLFFGGPRPRPWRLLVGPYATDGGASLIPRPGHRYVIHHD